MLQSVGIKHIEFWVSDLEQVDVFYGGLFELLGWQKSGDYSFRAGGTEIYFHGASEWFRDSLGPRHICFHATDREMVDRVGEFLRNKVARIIRGPVEMRGKHYSPGYYTVDFYDPDGYILEVAHSPKSGT